MEEFEDIFGPKYNPNLPLYVNLFVLREQNAYFTMVDAITNKNAMPIIIGTNTIWYYFLRWRMPG